MRTLEDRAKTAKKEAKAGMEEAVILSKPRFSIAPQQAPHLAPGTSILSSIVWLTAVLTA